jgi:hypothetical protein
MIKIKLLESVAGLDYSFRKGDEVTIDDYIAADLLKAGFAVELKENGHFGAKKAVLSAKEKR